MAYQAVFLAGLRGRLATTGMKSARILFSESAVGNFGQWVKELDPVTIRE